MLCALASAPTAPGPGRRKSARRRRSVVFAFASVFAAVVLLVGAAFLVWPERDLMARATPMVSVRDWRPAGPMPGSANDYLWASEHEILFERWRRPALRSMFRRDLRTGRETTVAGVRHLDAFGVWLRDAQVSPDGKWLLFREPSAERVAVVGPMMGRVVRRPVPTYRRVAVALDGSGKRIVWSRAEGERFPHLGRALWLPDSSGWLWIEQQFVTSGKNKGGRHRRQSMRAVATRFLLADPKGARPAVLGNVSYNATQTALGLVRGAALPPTHDAAPRRRPGWRVLGFETAPGTHLLTMGGGQLFTLFPPVLPAQPVAGAKGAAGLAAWAKAGTSAVPRMNVVAFDPDGVLPARKFSVRLPPGTVAWDVALSPNGNRLAWLLQTETYEPLVTLARRFAPNSALAARPATRRAGLWTSRPDGSDLRPIASMALPPLPVAQNPRLPARRGNGAMNAGQAQFVQAIMAFNLRRRNADKMPAALRWMPNGRRVSFVYNGSLWTVPVF